MSTGSLSRLRERVGVRRESSAPCPHPVVSSPGATRTTAVPELSQPQRLLVGDVSTGASGMGSPGSDLYRASDLAEMLVEVCGMSNLAAPLRSFRDEKGDRAVLSGSMAEAIDRQVNTIVVEAQAKAAAILIKHKADLLKIRDELMEQKTIEGTGTRS